jgi:hypothetical protein
MLFFDAEQRQQRDDATFAIVIDAHGKVDVLDGGDDE